MPLSRLRVAMLTRPQKDAETNDRIALSIKVGETELLNHIFPDTIQEDQERAQANLYEVNVEGKRIEPDVLTDSSVRLRIEGEDAWSPEHFFVWGEVPPTTVLQNTEILPLVIETEITETLSKDTDEGVRRIKLRRVEKGSSGMSIRRLLILLTTDKTQERTFPSLNTLEIQIVSNDRLVALSDIRGTLQAALLPGEANFYTMPVIFPFTKRSLNNQSITLRIKGGMAEWRPASFFLFGLDDAAGRPESIVPLVHLPKWPFGIMKPNTTNGIASVTLPLVQNSNVTGEFDDNGAVHTLQSIEAGQQTTNQLLSQLVAGIR